MACTPEDRVREGFSGHVSPCDDGKASAPARAGVGESVLCETQAVFRSRVGGGTERAVPVWQAGGGTGGRWDSLAGFGKAVAWSNCFQKIPLLRRNTTSHPLGWLLSKQKQKPRN